MQFKHYTNQQLIWEHQNALMKVSYMKGSNLSIRKLGALKSEFYGLESELKRRGIINSLTPWEAIR